MKAEIEARLQVLVGLPLTVSFRAVDMEMFSFGELVMTPPTRRHAGHLAGRYGLHVQCSWRIVCSESLIIGYADLREPRSDLGEDVVFDPNELQTTRREEVLVAFYEDRADRPRVVTAVAATEIGDLSIMLDDGCSLEVFPDVAAATREHWRFLDLLGDHLVIGGEYADLPERQDENPADSAG